jgi:hypothetical protein
MTLNATIPTGATSYNIYRGLTAGGEGSSPVYTGETAVPFTDTGLTDNTGPASS